MWANRSATLLALNRPQEALHNAQISRSIDKKYAKVCACMPSTLAPSCSALLSCCVHAADVISSDLCLTHAVSTQAWYREGKAFQAMHRWEDAACAFFEGHCVDPENKDLEVSFKYAIQEGKKAHKAGNT